jgi:hypothetical protein
MISGLAAGVLTLLAGLPTLAQDLEDAQLFAPADVSNYDGDQELKHGYFFRFDGLSWFIQKPQAASIGLAPPNSRTVFYGNDATAQVQTSSGDTSALKSAQVEGSRFDFGYVGEYNGWFVSGYKLQDQYQELWLNNASVVLNDPVVGAFGERSLQYLVNRVVTGPYPYADQPNAPYVPANERLVNAPLNLNITAENTVQNWGAEANYIRRFKTFHDGGNFDLYLGGRYFQFNEEFYVQTSAPTTYEPYNTAAIVAYLPRELDNSYWNTEVQNQIVGPQIGGRYYKNWGRFQLSLEGKFTAGFNEQTWRQDGEFASRIVPQVTTAVTGTQVSNTGVLNNFNATGFSNTATATQFSPLVELRAEARYELFQAVSLHAGWSGIWVDGIARASQSIYYSLPSMGIITSNNNTSVFINGVTFGVDVNY